MTEFGSVGESKSARHIDLPLQVAGLVVGKGGLKIKQIKQRSKAQVELAKDPLPSDANLKRLTIKGGSEEVRKAEVMVYDVLQKWCLGEDSQGNFALLPPDVQRRISEMPRPPAREGEGEQSSTAHEPFQQALPPPLPQSPQRSAEVAQRQALHQHELLAQQQQQQQQQQLNHHHQQQEPTTINVPNDCFRVLASDQGSQIASIEAMSGAKIEYAKWKQTPDSPDTWLAIHGNPTQVDMAYRMLCQVILHLRQGSQMQAPPVPELRAPVPIPPLVNGLQGPGFVPQYGGIVGVGSGAVAQQQSLAIPGGLAQMGGMGVESIPGGSHVPLSGGLAQIGLAHGGAGDINILQMLHQVPVARAQQMHDVPQMQGAPPFQAFNLQDRSSLHPVSPSRLHVDL